MWKIGDLQINGKVLLAPMAGYTSFGYRKFMEKFGVEIGDSLSLNGICEEKKDLNNKKYLTLTVK